jgi:hypothetical protein
MAKSAALVILPAGAGAEETGAAQGTAMLAGKRWRTSAWPNASGAPCLRPATGCCARST